MVSTTSRTRRSAAARISVMATNDQAPACRKDATTVSPAARIEIGTPVASGATACTARAKRHRPSSVCSSRPRKQLDAGAAVLGDPVGDEVGRQRFDRHRTGLQRGADPLEHDAERQDDRRRGGGADIGRGLLQAIERVRQPQRRLRRGPAVRRRLAQGRRRRRQRLPHLLVGRRRRPPARRARGRGAGRRPG